jgi:tripartite-type tricarboxylate transporter receptor subunit TctC
MPTRREFIRSAAASVFCAGTSAAYNAFAQVIAKPARLIVGFPPGGVPDVVARHIAERLRGTYAPAIIVENKPGAGGRIGVEALKNAEPDGSAILVTVNPMITIYPHVYPKLSYDPLRDLVPVTTLGSFPLLLVAGPGLPAEITSVAALVQWAKKHPDQASYGSSAAGSTQHFVGSMFAQAAGIKLTHVAYKGGAIAVQNLLGGQLPMAVVTPSTSIAHLRAGRLRAFATSGPNRSALLPDVPTFKEAGYADLVVEDWVGMFVPARTSAEIIAKLNGVVREALKSGETREAFAKLMIDPGGESPEECAKRVIAEHRMWGPIVKASGFVGDD